MRIDSRQYMLVIILFIVMFFWFGSKVSADNSFERQLKNQPLDFTYFTMEQGLSQANVFAMMQDKTGYMWFGTDDGLNKFDGYTFTVYKNDPSDPDSLSNNQINGIEEDSDGYLWIATYRGGLNQFNPITGKFKHYQFNPRNPNDPNGLSHEYINVMKQDKDGTL
jgi:ligand-binding sensor domain-containing protein